MMADDFEQRITRLETMMSEVLQPMIAEIRTDQKEMLAIVNGGRGVRRALLAIGSVGGAVAALVEGWYYLGHLLKGN